ncbi:hypothetical protein J2Z62_000088 [Mycoplasmoides fastidiosum]|uniref:DUF31 domain-containing protein n=1 Tax=Mycoplasmoides fastidiosum TaxID=92758 RepID=A0ABU0LY97_9BACT|nr:hypothetical protein [Mycoplasmoides fastidiosum]MDQ0513650.1 hypothetical protein [Mycoplasmoides fastidiosum]UUD37930.1 hypothetical protein NPA10_00845 [Mycoplasmoides fastidiosum]
MRFWKRFVTIVSLSGLILTACSQGVDPFADSKFENDDGWTDPSHNNDGTETGEKAPEVFNAPATRTTSWNGVQNQIRTHDVRNNLYRLPDYQKNLEVFKYINSRAISLVTRAPSSPSATVTTPTINYGTGWILGAANQATVKNQDRSYYVLTSTSLANTFWKNTTTGNFFEFSYSPFFQKFLADYELPGENNLLGLNNESVRSWQRLGRNVSNYYPVSFTADELHWNATNFKTNFYQYFKYEEDNTDRNSGQSQQNQPAESVTTASVLTASSSETPAATESDPTPTTTPSDQTKSSPSPSSTRRGSTFSQQDHSGEAESYDNKKFALNFSVIKLNFSQAYNKAKNEENLGMTNYLDYLQKNVAETENDTLFNAETDGKGYLVAFPQIGNNQQVSTLNLEVNGWSTTNLVLDSKTTGVDGSLLNVRTTNSGSAWETFYNPANEFYGHNLQSTSGLTGSIFLNYYPDKPLNSRFQLSAINTTDLSLNRTRGYRSTGDLTYFTRFVVGKQYDLINGSNTKTAEAPVSTNNLCHYLNTKKAADNQVRSLSYC